MNIFKKRNNSFQKEVSKLEASLKDWEYKLNKVKGTRIKDFSIFVDNERIYDEKFLPSDYVKHYIICDLEHKIQEIQDMIFNYKKQIIANDIKAEDKKATRRKKK